MSRRWFFAAVWGGCACLVSAGCSDHGATEPRRAQCGPAAALVGSGVSALVSSGGQPLLPLEGTTVRAEELSGCVALAADGGTYVVIPQFATAGGPSSAVPFTLGVGAPPSASRVAGALVAPPAGDEEPIALRFDRRLRAEERRLAPEAPAAVAAWRVQANVTSAALPTVGSTRTFHVLSSLDAPLTFATDTAVLRYAGSHLLIYVDQKAPPPPDGFTDAQLAAFGAQFDNELYDIDVQTFGEPSDIDGNGRLLVVLTPTVNQLTDRATCPTLGYVAGFFFGVDLVPSANGSNAGEVFYSLVPDSAGTFSCAHTVRQVEAVTPGTFLHEFQHMISYNQHVLLRHGEDEVPWLNEGLSHIAEEMGARYFESKYPPPLGRSTPDALFPDSAVSFIVPDLSNAYAFLLDPTQWSITKFIAGGSIQERGGAWLFLRWLGDQKDSTIYSRLEQTSDTGVENVARTADEPFATLFGDFSTALYTDSLPGVPRSSVPSRLRFASRNLRQLFQALYDANPAQRQRFPRPFPIAATTLAAPVSTTGATPPGTPDFFVLHMPTSGPPAVLSFTEVGGTPFDSTLHAQVSVFRCPTAEACP